MIKVKRDNFIINIICLIDDVLTSPIFALFIIVSIILYVILTGNVFNPVDCIVEGCEDGDIEFYRNDPKYGW